MRLEIRHLPASGRLPFCAVLVIGNSEIRQERYATRGAAKADLPDLAKVIRRANPGKPLEIAA